MKFLVLLIISLLIGAVLYVGHRKNIRYIPFFAQIGQPIDSFNGVDVYYNGFGDGGSGITSAPCGYRIGKKYQCVEFVKRYYYFHYNHKMTNPWGHAKDFFNPRVKDGKLNTERGLLQFTNGSASKPEPGDLLVYNNGKYGHVAIVVKVNRNHIVLIHQNPGVLRPSRIRHKLSFKEGVWSIEQKNLMGWLRKRAY